MANLCSNAVVLVGPSDAIKKFMDTVKEIASQRYDCQGKSRYRTITPEAIGKALGIPEGLGRSYDDAMGNANGYATVDEAMERLFLLSKEGTEVRFDCTTAWGSIDGFWEDLCDKLGLKGWASLSEVDGEYFVTNDREGIFFPERFVYDSYGEGGAEEFFGGDLEFEYYNSEEELAEALNSASGRSLSFGEWKSLIDAEEGSLGSVKEIDRDGQQLYPLDWGKTSRAFEPHLERGAIVEEGTGHTTVLSKDVWLTAEKAPASPYKEEKEGLQKTATLTLTEEELLLLYSAVGDAEAAAERAGSPTSAERRRILKEKIGAATPGYGQEISIDTSAGKLVAWISQGSYGPQVGVLCRDADGDPTDLFLAEVWDEKDEGKESGVVHAYAYEDPYTEDYTSSFTVDSEDIKKALGKEEEMDKD